MLKNLQERSIILDTNKNQNLITKEKHKNNGQILGKIVFKETKIAIIFYIICLIIVLFRNILNYI